MQTTCYFIKHEFASDDLAVLTIKLKNSIINIISYLAVYQDVETLQCPSFI